MNVEGKQTWRIDLREKTRALAVYYILREFVPQLEQLGLPSNTVPEGEVLVIAEDIFCNDVRHHP